VVIPDSPATATRPIAQGRILIVIGRATKAMLSLFGIQGQRSGGTGVGKVMMTFQVSPSSLDIAR